MDKTVAAGAVPQAGRREWAGLLVLALPTLLLSIDLSVLYLALPHLSADLRADSTQQLWIMDIYGFMIAGFLVTMGTLGDRIGRRRLLLIGATAFGLASVLAAYSDSPAMLIGARAVMGVAGATVMPSGLGLITAMFADPQQRGVAIAGWMSCFLGGIALGPVVGGVLLENFWWGSVFLLAVPVMVLVLAIAPAVLPRDHGRGGPGAARLDLASVALFLAAILPVIYGLKQLARDGWQLTAVAAIVAGAACGALFARRQGRLAHPLLDLRLFANRAFSSALALMLLVGAIQGGSLLLVNLYLQTVAGLQPLAAGLCLLPAALVMIASLMLSPRLTRRIRTSTLIASGLALSAVGYLLLTQVGSTRSLPLLVIGYSVVMIGVGPMSALVPNIVVGSAEPEKAGSAASIMNTCAELGIALGIATLGSLGTVIYRSQLDRHLPAGVPAPAAGTARASMANAVTAAQDLGGQVGADLLDAARNAFTTALNVVSGAGVLLFLGVAVLAATALRHVTAGPPAAPPADAGPAESAVVDSAAVDSAVVDRAAVLAADRTAG